MNNHFTSHKQRFYFDLKEFESVCIPEKSVYRNCKVCYQRQTDQPGERKKEIKTNVYCSAPQCQVFLCFTSDRNCFKTWHSSNYCGKRD